MKLSRSDIADSIDGNANYVGAVASLLSKIQGEVPANEVAVLLLPLEKDMSEQAQKIRDGSDKQ